MQKEQLEKLKQSTITVSDNKNNTSGALYYFSTQRVYICTNGSTENTVAANGSIVVNYVDENNNVIGSDTYKGVAGETITIKAKDIEGYEVEGISSTTVKYSEEGTEVTFKYKKLKCVTVEYRDNANKDIILSTEKHYGKLTDTYSITAKEQIQYNGSYYNINKNETFTGTYDSNKTVTYYYNKCNVTINYIDESGNSLADSEHEYINSEYEIKQQKDIGNKYAFEKVTFNNETVNVGDVRTISGETIINYIYKIAYEGVKVIVPHSSWITEAKLYISYDGADINGSWQENRAIPSTWSVNTDENYFYIPSDVKAIDKSILLIFHNGNTKWSENINIPEGAKTVVITDRIKYEITEKYSGY